MLYDNIRLEKLGQLKKSTDPFVYRLSLARTYRNTWAMLWPFKWFVGPYIRRRSQKLLAATMPVLSHRPTVRQGLPFTLPHDAEEWVQEKLDEAAQTGHP